MDRLFGYLYFVPLSFCPLSLFTEGVLSQKEKAKIVFYRRKVWIQNGLCFI